MAARNIDASGGSIPALPNSTDVDPNGRVLSTARNACKGYVDLQEKVEGLQDRPIELGTVAKQRAVAAGREIAVGALPQPDQVLRDR